LVRQQVTRLVGPESLGGRKGEGCIELAIPLEYRLPPPNTSRALYHAMNCPNQVSASDEKEIEMSFMRRPLLPNRRDFMASVTAGAAAFTGSRFLSAASADETSDGLIIHGTSPMNAEPRLPDLVRSWMTPVENFYIRSHAPVPVINQADFRLSIEGFVERPLSLSLKELSEGFEQQSVVATMTCAGNRRSEHGVVKPVKGVQWREGAIGNAKWSGIRLSDVLKRAGVKAEAKHVWFEGLDEITRSSGVIPFGASIPLEKALADTASSPGALLTTMMNDYPLTGDHGAPLRTVVPGYIGARSVKWLGRVVVSDRPSSNHYVATAYKLVERGDPLEWSEQGPIYRMPLNSAICLPQSGSTRKPGQVSVSGYALPPGSPGATIAKVEVSVDGGDSWLVAKITSPVRENCWVLWQARVPVNVGFNGLAVRATDSNGKTQPKTVDWNLKGYLFNAWHHVRVTGV
jgi:sulfite oxidase